MYTFYYCVQYGNLGDSGRPYELKTLSIFDPPYVLTYVTSLLFHNDKTHIYLPDELEVYTKKLLAKSKKSNNARGKVRSN